MQAPRKTYYETQTTNAFWHNMQGQGYLKTEVLSAYTQTRQHSNKATMKPAKPETSWSLQSFRQDEWGKDPH